MDAFRGRIVITLGAIVDIAGDDILCIFHIPGADLGLISDHAHLFNIGHIRNSEVGRHANHVLEFQRRGFQSQGRNRDRVFLHLIAQQQCATVIQSQRKVHLHTAGDK